MSPAKRKKPEVQAVSAEAPSQEGAEALPFEAALEQLEGIVDQLESGELELEQALGAFEQGVRLSQRCAAELDSAERRIEALVREGGEWVARPFEPASEADRDADTETSGDGA